MAGHNKWKQIKDRKAVVDKKRSALFGKFLNAIAIAAREDRNPETNFQLKAAVQRARDNHVPKENIERVLDKSESQNLEESRLEAYGPEGSAMIIEIITDNKNRSIPEIKKILGDQGAKIADPGSVLWAFEKIGSEWRSKFPKSISVGGRESLKKIAQSLEEREDVQGVITNANPIE